MLQYLFNATAIWLLSLLLFDVFLRREKYHGYNRLFLLCTFLLGIFLPLWHWQDDTIILATGMYTPVQNAAAARQAVVSTASTPVQDWQGIFWYLYFAGVVVGIVLLVKEALVIRRLYTQGIRSKDGVWTIIETGKAHSPFSAFRCVYISSRNDYSPAQLSMILVHEEQHGHSLHFVDLLLFQLARVVLWFHPLVYLYHNRVMMVHEFQADAAVQKQPGEYGQFLIEQSILGAAPALSHSFNRSPIKKRIMMLTRKASGLAKFRKLVAVPLVLACTLFFTQKTFSRDARKEDNKLFYKGNVFELWAPPNGDTVMVEDAVTGEWILKILKADSIPVKMNNETIYKEDELSGDEKEALAKTKRKIQEYIYEQIRPEMEKLKDGIYWLHVNQLVLDKKGNIVYHLEPSVRMDGNPKEKFPVISKKISGILAGHSFDPVMRGDKPVVFMIRYDMFTDHDLIKVNGHKVTY